MRLSFLLRLSALLMVVVAGYFLVTQTNERRGGYGDAWLKSFGDLEAHVSKDYFRIHRYEPKELVEVMLSHEDLPLTRFVPLVGVARGYFPVDATDVTYNTISMEQVKVEYREVPFSAIGTDEKDLIVYWPPDSKSPGLKDGYYYRAIIYYFTDTTAGYPKVVDVKISPGVALAGLTFEESAMQILRNNQDWWDDPKVHDLFERRWRHLKLLLANFKANSGLEVSFPLYSNEEIEILRLVPMVHLTHRTVVETGLQAASQKKAQSWGSTSVSSYLEATPDDQIVSSMWAHALYDWTLAYVGFIPKSFDRVVTMRNLHLSVSLLSLLTFAILAAWVVLARDPKQRSLSYGRFILRLTKDPLLIVCKALHFRYRQQQEKWKVAVKQRQKETCRQDQLRRNDERRRQKEGERRAAIAVRLINPAPPIPYKLEPAAKVVEVPEPPKLPVKVVEIAPEVNRGLERQLIMSDLRSLIDEFDQQILDLVLEKCHTIKHLRELLILLQTVHEQKRGGSASVKSVLEELVSKRVPTDHLHASTELFRRVLRGDFAPSSKASVEVGATEQIVEV